MDLSKLLQEYDSARRSSDKRALGNLFASLGDVIRVSEDPGSYGDRALGKSKIPIFSKSKRGTFYAVPTGRGGYYLFPDAPYRDRYFTEMRGLLTVRDESGQLISDKAAHGPRGEIHQLIKPAECTIENGESLTLIHPGEVQLGRGIKDFSSLPSTQIGHVPVSKANSFNNSDQDEVKNNAENIEHNPQEKIQSNNNNDKTETHNSDTQNNSEIENLEDNPNLDNRRNVDHNSHESQSSQHQRFQPEEEINTDAEHSTPQESHKPKTPHSPSSPTPQSNGQENGFESLGRGQQVLIGATEIAGGATLHYWANKVRVNLREEREAKQRNGVEITWGDQAKRAASVTATFLVAPVMLVDGAIRTTGRDGLPWAMKAAMEQVNGQGGVAM